MQDMIHHETVENKAPLADLDLEQMQGLTLEDLAQLHGQTEHTHSDQTNSEDSSDQDASQADSEDNDELANLLASSEPNLPESTFEIHPEKQLQQALIIGFGKEELHLDQKEDIETLQQHVNHLFQHDLPDTMQQLGQYLHAREQSNYLYSRLSELTQQRSSANEIIQAGKQIEALERILQNGQPQAQELQALEQKLLQFEQVISRYRELCQLAQQIQ